MKKVVFVIAILVGCVVTSNAQKPSLELTFTAIDSATHLQLDSIKVMNRTQGGDTVLYYPDTVLVLDYMIGVEEVYEKEEGLRVYQNYPNPVVNNTTISMYVPKKGLVRCMTTNIMGGVVHLYEEVLVSGVHSFSYSPGGGEMSFFTAFYGNSQETIKILHPNHNKSGSVSLSYIGTGTIPEDKIKASETMQGFSFNLGDTLLYIGYVNEMESGILDEPAMSDTIPFQFATNIPCPGIPTVTYEGQVYNTVQIFSQCWLKENLNAGIFLTAYHMQTDNGIIEKHCYGDNANNCNEYGGLYIWREMMNYCGIPGTQGICPIGWHIPTDDEFKILEGMVDSFYDVGDSIWNSSGYRGYDAGFKLKSTEGWLNSGNGNDEYGFTAIPGGIVWWDFYFHYFQGFGYHSNFFSSEEFHPIEHRYRTLHGTIDGIGRSYTIWGTAQSVRCIKD